MGCGDACPIFPGKRYEDWELDDPAGQGIDAVRPIRDEIRRRVETAHHRALISSGSLFDRESSVPDLVIESLFDYDGLMIKTSTDQPAAPALQAAVDSLDVAVEHLIKLVDDGALGDLGAFGLVDTLQSLEKVRNKLPVVDRAITSTAPNKAARRAGGKDHDQDSTNGIRISIGEASRRVGAAEHLADRTSMTRRTT